MSIRLFVCKVMLNFSVSLDRLGYMATLGRSFGGKWIFFPWMCCVTGVGLGVLARVLLFGFVILLRLCFILISISIPSVLSHAFFSS